MQLLTCIRIISYFDKVLQYTLSLIFKHLTFNYKSYKHYIYYSKMYSIKYLYYI